jgi:hypothetical protein
MMRENDQTQQTKTQGELIPERQIPSNIPLMSMTPISSTTNSSSVFHKDLTSALFEQNPSQSFSGMSTSQTMPSLIRPTIVNTTRPTPNFSSSSKTTDLTSSLLNNMNSLASRPQTTPYLNSGTTGVGLFQPSLVGNGTNPKSAAAELDDLFN